MQIETKYSGIIEIEEKQIIHFSQGIPSFEDEQAFILLPFSEEPSPFYILQSVHTPELAFVMANPFPFFPDYKVELSDGTIEQLAVEEKDDVAIFTMLTVKDPFEQTTTNLRGPVVINSRNQKAKQILLNDSEYDTRHRLLTKASAQAGEA
nr:flagellar assembly protein FliW [Alteribacter populi]